jgi:hypothetical protein
MQHQIIELVLPLLLYFCLVWISVHFKDQAHLLSFCFELFKNFELMLLY